MNKKKRNPIPFANFTIKGIFTVRDRTILSPAEQLLTAMFDFVHLGLSFTL